MSENLNGTVERVIYRNADNGYSVLELKGTDGLLFAAVGTMPLPEAGELLDMYGVWTEHKTYGRQFRVEHYTIVQPTELDDIENYLANGTIKGIGKSVAHMIVEKFGEKTFEILEKTPERLMELPGIGKKKYEQITTSYNMQMINREIMFELQKYDITPAQASNIYRRYGDDSVNIVKKNPYRLIDDVENIGFKIADRIARSVGFAYNSEYRISAGIKFMLEWAKQEGHTYLPRDVLVNAVAKTLNVSEEETEPQLTELLRKKLLVENIIENRRVVFLPYMRKAEMNIAVKLVEQDRHFKSFYEFQIDEEIDRAAKKQGLSPAEKQTEALKAIFQSGVTLITGGPGTGKTTILRLAIDIMQTWDMSFELCAPTGRAAKRMSLATGQKAQTIHRLLEYSFTEQTFMRDENDPIDADFIIVDEMSMVDVLLMDALLKAVTEDTHIVLVGDADQLPSVGAGNVLQDIIKSGMIHSVCLTEIYRQAAESMIISNAHRINNGNEPVLDDAESDFNFYEMADPATITDAVVSAFTDSRQTILRTENIRDDVQVLAPMKKGTIGVNNLNSVLQNALNPHEQGKAEITYGETVYRVGDKVMQIKNNYSIEWTRSENGVTIEDGKGIFNGDIGVITDIDENNRCVEIQFESGAVTEYTQDMLQELSLAYCISIHKSQGSEFHTVMLVIPNAAPSFLTRNLLYTAVTRARSQVCIFGRRDTINAMVYNKSTKARYTALYHIMKEYGESL